MVNVLHVEDVEDQRMIVGARLRKAGYNVVSVGTTAEAIAVVTTKGLPDVAVLDVGLPDGDGRELLQRLREIGDGTTPAAVFLSAGNSEEDIASVAGTGVQYLTKPFIATALVNAINAALANQPVAGDTW